MRIIQTLLLLVSFSFFANAERKSAVLSDGTKCNYETDKGMLNGEYRSYYDNGKLKCEGSFLQNNRYGFWVFYQPNGKIQSMRDYKNNYSFEEKSSDNKSKRVVWNENNTWTPIQEKDIITKSRFIISLLQEDNKALFSEEKIVENILRAAKASSNEIFSDNRFVTPISKDVLNNANIIGFKLKEDRILDKATKVLQYRIIGIAPLIYSIDEKAATELCWIYYPEIKSELGKIKINVAYTNSNKTFLDIFENRTFSSKIDLVGYMHSEMNKTVDTDVDHDLNVHPLIMDIEQENTFISNNFANN